MAPLLLPSLRDIISGNYIGVKYSRHLQARGYLPGLPASCLPCGSRTHLTAIFTAWPTPAAGEMQFGSGEENAIGTIAHILHSAVSIRVTPIT